MKIFIDPGHGGEDPGAVNTEYNISEATINLDVAKKLDVILKNRGYETKLSRDGNYYVSLSKRAEMANNWYANYFVSIHCNSAADSSANGTETLYYLTSKKGEALANEVQVQLILQNGLRDRGIKPRNLAVLRLTNMPAILVELAFISNNNEAYLLSQSSFQDKCALGIADGLTQYINAQ